MPTFPGVYIAEDPAGPRPIAGVPTAVGAFVGWFPKGPMNVAVPLLSFTDVEREFGGLHTLSDTSFALWQYFRNGGHRAWAVRVAAPGAGAEALAKASVTLPTAGAGNAFDVHAASEGAWGNDLTVQVIGPDDDGRFDLVVTLRGGLNGRPTVKEEERFTGLTTSPTDPRYLPLAVNGVSRLIGVAPSSGEYSTPLGSGVTSYELAGGGDGARPGAAEIVGSEAAGSGMFALEDTDFTLLCLPSIANQVTSALDGLADIAEYETITGSAIAFCRKKRALVLLDPPDRHTSTTAIRTWLADHPSIRDEYAALYYPRVTIADPTQSGQSRSIGSSGTVAGVMARIDSQRGVWKSPSGTEATLLGLLKLDVDLTDPQVGELSRLAINCLRQTAASSRVVWGARTLAGTHAATSESSYVPVRRLANYLESSLLEGLQWVVFEPNDEALWSQIRLSVGSFMQALFSQHAFAGVNPSDAYLVRCDPSTTTSADQANGIVNVVVGFAPLRPAEFVILRVQQAAGKNQG